MIFTSIIGLVVGMIALVAGLMLVTRLRKKLPTTMLALIAIGLTTFALAMGEPTLCWPIKQNISVMVDLSASTRGAAYRDPEFLRKRIATLLGDVPHETTYFAYDNVASASGHPLNDLRGQETRFVPPASQAVVLFSDAQFTLPRNAPPTYMVVDPNLEQVNDAAVASLHQVNELASAEVVNHGPQRAISSTGTDRPGPTTVPTSGTVVSAKVLGTSQVVTARLNAADAWPENDALTIRIPQPAQAERWWMGDAAPASGWRAMVPPALPTDASAYLNSSIIVLSNVAADALSLDQQQRLSQYVGDLGGTLVIAGGEHAFAAGGYARTFLDDLSPLASTPPSPTTHWILLIDSSGSMATPVDGGTRFTAATNASRDLLSHLPASDLASIGGFARELSWWVSRKQPSQISQPFPPSDAGPTGPTNLQASLEAISQSADRSLPNELLIVTDTDAAISDSVTLASALKPARVRVSVLSIGESIPNAALKQIASATGGHFLRQTDAVQWPAAMRELARSIAPENLGRGPVLVNFVGPLGFLSPRSAGLLNRTWLKNDATQAGTAQFGGEKIPAAGLWQLGAGRVIAIAMELSAADGDAIAERFAQPPTDPRFQVTWEDAATLTVRINASKADGYLNALAPSLQLFDASNGITETHLIAQTAPGRYTLSLPAPTEPMLAKVLIDGRIIARSAIAGHYPREFSSLGNDRSAMTKLAEQTGGEVIEPAYNQRIDFRWPVRTIPLAPWLAASGAIMIGAALIRWRRG